MNNQSSLAGAANHPIHFGVRERSDKLINYFLFGYFLIGMALAPFYGTWLIATGVGGLSLLAYYSAKIALPQYCLYQYILSIILGVFMAQFIFQMHGMFEMHFFAFIGSALLVTYQKWTLQLPMLLFVLIHHAVLSYLQNIGFSKVYFSQLEYFDLQTFTIHILLTFVIYFICGLCAFQLHKYEKMQIGQALQMEEMQKEAQLFTDQRKNAEAMEERNTILESIGDAFFAVDKNWVVTYWNKMAEKVLFKPKEEMLNHNLWSVFSGSVDSLSYRKYNQAIRTNKAVHFEDYFSPLDKWYEISAYPSPGGLSVYFKDITERKQNIADLQESEKRYSDVFHFSPLPTWIVDLGSLKFMDVNRATIDHYGYSREEFLTMTLKDIRPPEEIARLEQELERDKNNDTIRHKIMIHKKKDGTLINVEIQIAPFQYKGAKRSIVIATDITERLKYIKAIEEQNEKLITISWMQSHMVRAPLTRIMALIPMIKDPKTHRVDKEKMIDYLLVSADELDTAIKNITEVTSTVAVK